MQVQTPFLLRSRLSKDLDFLVRNNSLTGLNGARVLCKFVCKFDVEIDNVLYQLKAIVLQQAFTDSHIISARWFLDKVAWSVKNEGEPICSKQRKLSHHKKAILNNENESRKQAMHRPSSNKEAHY